jgi:hypothetical protein
MLIYYGNDRFGYTPYTDRQKIAALEINPYLTAFEFQWIGDEDFYRMMCPRCQRYHAHFVLNSFWYNKHRLLESYGIEKKDSLYHNYMHAFDHLPMKKPQYRFCKDKTCVLYAKKHVLQGSVFPRTGMKYVYNHASFHSKVMIELEVKANYYPGQWMWYKINDHFPLVNVRPMVTVDVVKVPIVTIDITDGADTLHGIRMKEVSHITIDDDEVHPLPPLSKKPRTMKYPYNKHRTYKERFADHSLFLYELVFCDVNPTWDFDGTMEDFVELLRFRVPYYRLNNKST